MSNGLSSKTGRNDNIVPFEFLKITIDIKAYL